MKNKEKIIKKILLIVFILLFVVCSNKVFALEGLSVAEETEEYKEYMQLSDEEKAQVLEPKRYNVLYPETSTSYLSESNVFKITNLLTSTLGESYDLRKYISTNLTVRNQEETNSCWAFAGVGLLESNLAMLDYKSGNTGTVYDYSERHMFYSAKRTFFNNGEVNEYGYTTEESGGNFYEVLSYLTNGMGAIKESDMPFENNEDYIDLSEIQNKEVLTTLYDTIEFEDIDDIGKTELMAKMKETISTYGGIYAGIHGASLLSDAYNNVTGAIYCDSSSNYVMNHAVVIIGWDDNYSKDNFNEDHIPTSNGAWIIKNSWGDKISEDLAEIKEAIYNKYEQNCNELGWYSAEDISADYIIQLYESWGYGKGKVSIEDDKLVIEVGDDGYMYVSYEDANIYDNLYAIKEASNEKDYDELYQYNKLVASVPISYKDSQVYIASKFDRNSSSENEYINMVSIYTLQEVTATVYVNSSDSDLTKAKLQEVELEGGSTSITLEPGFHTIEFAEPIQLTGDSFAVAFGLTTDEDTIYFMQETKSSDENIEIEAGRCYFASADTFNVDYWEDLGTYEVESVRGNLSIKAYTTYEEEVVVATLDKIEVTTNPTKLVYTQGEDFDQTDMVVTATYTDGTTKEITDYEITDGTNLYYGQSYVTISYTEDGETRTTTVNITVNKNDYTGDVNVVDVQISSLPTKLTYIQNEEELNLDGGVLLVTYSDGSTAEVSMKSSYVTVSGFDNTVIGTQTIVIRYMNRDLTFEIEVVAADDETVVSPVLSDFSNMSSEIAGADIYLYSDESASYIEIQIDISNVINGSDSTNYTYYYYFSDTASEDNIDNWVKIENPTITVDDNGVKTISFKVNSNDIPNYREIYNADTVYLYLKEEAEASGQTTEQVVFVGAIEADGSNITIYYDDEEIGTIEDAVNISGNNYNSGTVNDSEKDTTTASGILPQAGVISIGVLIIVIIGFGVYTFMKHRNIDK